jgi:anti-sigma B factor antagonist
MTDHSGTDAVTITTDTDGAVVVTGEIDMASGPLVESAAAVTEGTPVVIDVSGVTFIDSSGLRSLLAISRAATAASTTVTLRGVGAEVARLLEITGTGSLFTVESR